MHLKISTTEFGSYQNGRAATTCLIAGGGAPVSKENILLMQQRIEPAVTALQEKLGTPEAGAPMVTMQEYPEIGWLITAHMQVGQGLNPSAADKKLRSTLTKLLGSPYPSHILEKELPAWELAWDKFGSQPRGIVARMLSAQAAAR